ncbi:MAG: hypothetical protein M2R45_03425 [Verrucomicrobia subdivision 3 bacterium]|nr:hypothetical protein [Limisphaerales bacterium]MCS1416329.1 hypothetical protein [Limisphaerales bacterium]
MLREPITSGMGSCRQLKQLLAEALARHGAGQAELATLPGDEMPEPYRRLLVHDADMTSTLKRFHEDTLSLKVLHLEVLETELQREVLLCRDLDRRPVEYGVIRIVLTAFELPAREAILEGAVPLGQILDTFGVEYVSQPNEYFQLGSNAYIGSCLADGDEADRFGRVNTLSQPSGGTLAEVVEILPVVAFDSAD